MEAVTKDYLSYFDWRLYLEDHLKNANFEPSVFQNLNKFWSQMKHNDLKVLEYGGGPNLSRLISACPRVKDFVFAEYLEKNRNAVQKWIDKDPKAFDWSNTFEFIVQQLEGKGPDEVAQREDELRHKIRAIVPCDIKAENILDIPANLVEKYGPPYDVIATSLCLEVAVESEQEYKDTVSKLAKMVKPGGYLMMYATIGETFYTVGSTKFYTFPLTKEMVEDSMENAGVKDLVIDMASSDTHVNYMPFADTKDEMFVYGRLG